MRHLVVIMLSLFFAGLATAQDAQPPQTLTVFMSGRVVDPNSKPVSGATVVVSVKPIKEPGYTTETLTNQAGSYQLKINGGPSLVWAHTQDRVSRLEYKPMIEHVLMKMSPEEQKALANRIHLEHNLVLDLKLEDKTPEPLVVEVVDRNGDPIEGAQVRVFSEYPLAAPLATKPNGRAEFNPFPFWENYLSIEVRHPNFVMVHEGAEQSPVRIVMANASIFRGRVYDGETNEPITRFKMGREGSMQEFQSKTGEFSYPDPRTEGPLLVKAEGYMMWSFANWDDDGSYLKYDERHSIPLWKPGELEAIVLDKTTNQPLEGAVIKQVPFTKRNAYDVNRGLTFKEATGLLTRSNKEGRFPIRDEEGMGTFEIKYPGYLPRAVFPAQQREDNVIYHLVPESRLQGRLFVQGKTLAGANVSMHQGYRDDGTNWHTTFSADTISGQVLGDFSIGECFESASYSFYAKTADLSVQCYIGMQERETLTLDEQSFAGPCQVTGQATVGKSAIPQITITASIPMKPEFVTARSKLLGNQESRRPIGYNEAQPYDPKSLTYTIKSDSKGEFSLSCLPAGMWTFKASGSETGSGLARGEVNLELKPGQNTVRIPLQLPGYSGDIPEEEVYLIKGSIEAESEAGEKVKQFLSSMRLKRVSSASSQDAAMDDIKIDFFGGRGTSIVPVFSTPALLDGDYQIVLHGFFGEGGRDNHEPAELLLKHTFKITAVPLKLE